MHGKIICPSIKEQRSPLKQRIDDLENYQRRAAAQRQRASLTMRRKFNARSPPIWWPGCDRVPEPSRLANWHRNGHGPGAGQDHVNHHRRQRGAHQPWAMAQRSPQPPCAACLGIWPLLASNQGPSLPVLKNMALSSPIIRLNRREVDIPFVHACVTVHHNLQDPRLRSTSPPSPPSLPLACLMPALPLVRRTSPSFARCLPFTHPIPACLGALSSPMPTANGAASNIHPFLLLALPQRHCS